MPDARDLIKTSHVFYWEESEICFQVTCKTCTFSAEQHNIELSSQPAFSPWFGLVCLNLPAGQVPESLAGATRSWILHLKF